LATEGSGQGESRDTGEGASQGTTVGGERVRKNTTSSCVHPKPKGLLNCCSEPSVAGFEDILPNELPDKKALVFFQAFQSLQLDRAEL
jgi:hypothetical protein